MNSLAAALLTWRAASHALASALPHTDKWRTLNAREIDSLDQLIAASKAAGWTKGCGLGVIAWAEAEVAKAEQKDIAQCD